MEDFFKLISTGECTALLDRFAPLASETVPLSAALGRVLAADIVARELLPPFSRSTMDGFAVRAANTFGCSESETALLTVVGEIAMGEPGRTLALAPGQAARIWTGGELPDKADAVVMVEYTRLLDPTTVAVFRPVAGSQDTVAGQDPRHQLRLPGRPGRGGGRRRRAAGHLHR